MNPNGRDAVMLMEDAERSVTLDALEAQYYRAVLCDERLGRHIGVDPGIRYGAGCRDVTARLAQDDLTLASGLLSRQVRTAGRGATVAIWRTAAGRQRDKDRDSSSQRRPLRTRRLGFRAGRRSGRSGGGIPGGTAAE